MQVKNFTQAFLLLYAYKNAQSIKIHNIIALSKYLFIEYLHIAIPIIQHKKKSKLKNLLFNK